MDNVIDELSKEFKLDKRVIKLIVNNPLKFFKQECVYSNDNKAFRIESLGVFHMKKKNGKLDQALRRMKVLLDQEVSNLLVEFNCSNEEEVKDHFNILLEDKNYKAIEELYKRYRTKHEKQLSLITNVI